MFRFLLVDRDGQPIDPAAFVTAIPNWSEGELITLGAGEQLRILATQPDIDEELIEQGSTACSSSSPSSCDHSVTTRP